MSFVQDKTAYWIWTIQLYSYTGHFIQSLITTENVAIAASCLLTQVILIGQDLLLAP